MSDNQCGAKRSSSPVSRLVAPVRWDESTRTHPALVMIKEGFQRGVQARRRRTAIRELSRLDDRQLQDIGIERDKIPEVVSGMLRRQIGLNE